MGTDRTTQRENGSRTLRRAAGVLVASALCLVAAPAVASAAPVNPSDAQIGAAQQQKDAAAAQVGEISAQLATAQAGLDAARAQSAIALDTFQGKQADYEAAQLAADAAAAAALQASLDLDTARADIAAFARQSYVQGSTSPTLEALMTADGPTQMIERAALLEAAGGHRGDVVVEVTAAEAQARAADQAAEAALADAETLKAEAEEALAVAEQYEAGARAQAGALAAQQASVQQQLEQAQQTLHGLQGARAAAEQYAAQQAAAQQAAAARAAAAQAAAAQAAAAQAAAAAQNAPRTPQTPNRPVVSAPVETPRAGAGNGSAVETAIAAAQRQLGVIYSWGGGSLSGPSMGWGVDAGIIGFDCSGLTRYAYAQAGISIPRNSSAQYKALPKVSRADLQRGDLVFWATNTSNPSTIHHVAIYLGGGRILEAPQSGSVIRETSMRWSGFIGGARPSA